ncbi:hypothetical protein Ait01nite_012270 [Actinoplanes italicus]|uniref:Uncharacterized protein n=1 Tax=Actinoplanes italicus TaxID=113567 RepID=A0A2T0KGV1_9ACTN|nr:hypothetical protein [Actinoplanes italicus]PRX22663.1 hypothetical protein CLV67_104191 [Actinoplanes italicus]GIE28182.1 hypothetical protein Ait01nite_012270 [Actinoplanes italicus]
MAADLRALLWNAADHGDTPHLPVVPLPAGLVLLPLTGDVIATVTGGDRGDPPVDGFYELTTPIAGWARRHSHHGTVAYLHSEFFGSGGFQAAVAWKHGDVVWGPLFTATSPGEAEDHYTVAGDHRDMAANVLLRHLGVDRGEAFDEYAAAGLQQQRWTGDW